jgi:hypothetical protein
VREDGFKPNPGTCPEEAKGKRVLVELADGRQPRYADVDDPMAPPGWPADGKTGCCWRKRGLPFDIAFYKLIR